jgi:hypothetical protein
MIYFLSISLLFFCSGIPALSQQANQKVEVEKISEQFFTMDKVKDGALNLYFRLKPLDLSNDPVLLAYRGAASAAAAGSVDGVYKKLQYFSLGKSELEEAVKAGPRNPEIHFLRLATQVKAPSFLGYHKNIKADKELILNSLASINGKESNAYLYYRICDFLVYSKILNDQELKLVNQCMQKIKPLR